MLGRPKLSRMDANVAIDMLGGTSAAADFFEVKPPSVSEWRVRGIPKARLMYLKVSRPDIFVASQKRPRRSSTRKQKSRSP